MNQKTLKYFFGIFAVVAIVAVGSIMYWFGLKNQNNTTPPIVRPVSEVFTKQEECQVKTGKVCDLQMCDNIPQGKTYEEVCGKNFRTGWVPTERDITPSNWQHVDADSFRLSLPPKWQLNKLQGIDSYVGEVVGDGAKLGFDYGLYSNPLAEDNDPNHIVTYETIGGWRAKIVVPKVTGSGTTGVYFGVLQSENHFNLYGTNLTASQQETALKIFRTIEFK